MSNLLNYNGNFKYDEGVYDVNYMMMRLMHVRKEVTRMRVMTIVMGTRRPCTIMIVDGNGTWDGRHERI